MKSKEFELKGNSVVVVDAPSNATHSTIGVYDGLNFLIHKKSKILELHPIDESKSDGEIQEKYANRLVNVGKLETAQNGITDDLFNMVQRGNFYDYEHNGVFYPSSKSALKDIISMESGFLNPFVMIIKPEQKINDVLLADTIQSM